MSKNHCKRSDLIKKRKEVGLTQKQMAQMLKITRATYANYENGYRNPSLKIVIKMKEILGVDDDAIFLPVRDTESVKIMK